MKSFVSDPSALCPTLAVFGTASDVGKSMIAAGLCRILSDAGLRTAPFKAQNMSNNSAVTALGGEIGRAQVVQAWAARTEPHVDMNPVLLKPGGEDGSQVVILGQPWKNSDALTYFSETPLLREHAFGALNRLREQYECVVLEGAGSCAEVNLRSREFVNFPAAHEADAPVVLVADIERGGVFAQIVGSLAVMPPEDQRRVVGFIVNRFRGNRQLFDDGVTYLEERTKLPVFGVVPFVHGLGIDSEDSLSLDLSLDPVERTHDGSSLRIAVIYLPHTSNATDFDALSGLDAVTLHFLRRPRDLESYDLVLLPGTKNVRSDLAWLRANGWESTLDKYHRGGGRLGGVCGGYQMMGAWVDDPQGIEGPPGKSPGLGFLPVGTTLTGEKILRNVRGTWRRLGSPVFGYEIHMGRTEMLENSAGFQPAVEQLIGAEAKGSREAARSETSDPDDRCDGWMHPSGRLWGTYLHGLFDSPAFLESLLAELQPEHAQNLRGTVQKRSEKREQSLNDWADHLRAHLDLPLLFQRAGLSLPG